LILADPPPVPIVQAAPPPPEVVPPASPPEIPQAHTRHAPGDPLEKFNRNMFSIHQKLDRAIFRPAAMGYKNGVPRPVRSGLRHFFSNLGEPVVFANFVLQLKPKSAARTLVRFLINSTIGIGGTIDVAKGKAFELPHQPNGFGDTLGFYGVKPGPYLFLPLVGPSDFRDFIGGQADGLALPLAVGKPFDRMEYQVPKAVITGLDQRAEADADLHALLDDALDPYATLRSVYLQDRAGEIAALRGKPADVSMPGDLEDPAASGAKAAPAPELQDPLADPAAAPQPKPKSSAPELQDPLADPAAAPTAPKPAASGAVDPGAPVRR
jgi:phospholipid-binding lipoprotein MlaA